ncbi:ATP-dependent DNA helicase RecQ [Terrimonas rubra]|uniref:ATP-dependent DNA helicase RecQ n=1 Tax=Terrimonas rubra TaxID=1035890 RepID=A0ABW6A2A4_9BACT
MISPTTILQQYWGFGQFRPMQQDIIEAVLANKDTLALMPTGGGKSLCYQVPALCRPGVCLVISPLIALMKDQVENLRKKNITAFAIHTGMNRREVEKVLQTAGNSNCKFLYVSPERLETRLFLEYLPALAVNLIAVDEAHCISQWGYDFRPPYLRIAKLREELPNVPVLALTASATPDVQQDICDSLQWADVKPASWAVFKQSFERANLSYSVFDESVFIPRIADILSKVPGTAIVYCRTRKQTRDIAEQLRLLQVPADYYHAGLTQEQRHARQEAWINNKVKVIVCTNAFGMGIDKPDVRLVIHAGVPDCLENYYQEAGRAGRDGKKSYAVLLTNNKETDQLLAMPDIRYPLWQDIQQVYQSLVNYLQVPSGGGKDESYDFNIGEFTKKFNLHPHNTFYALQAIQSDGWFMLSESVFKPSTVAFNCTKQYLYAFEEKYPQLEPVIKALLRAYEGIFDKPVNIAEKTIAYLLRSTPEAVKEQLLQLQAHKIIQYEPQKEEPQVYWLRNRVPVAEFKMDMQAYDKRKKVFTARIEQMIAFVQSTTVCRAKMIGNYFGDNKINDCGICDVCLAKKQTPLDGVLFREIEKAILEILATEAISPEALVQQLRNRNKTHVNEVLRFLLSENMISQDKDGKLAREK